MRHESGCVHEPVPFCECVSALESENAKLRAELEAVERVVELREKERTEEYTRGLTDGTKLCGPGIENLMVDLDRWRELAGKMVEAMRFCDLSNNLIETPSLKRLREALALFEEGSDGPKKTNNLTYEDIV